MTLQLLSRFKRRTAAAERIKHNVTLVRRKLDAASGNHGLKFVDMPSGFELSMARRGCIVPKVREV